MALREARSAFKKACGRKKIRLSRIIPFNSKIGFCLPVISNYAGLSPLDSLTGETSTITRTNAKKATE